MRFVVTGATGYIGSCLTDLALKRGHKIVIMSRKRPLSFAPSWIFFDLSLDHLIVLPPGVDAVVHLAANTTQTTSSEDKREVFAAQMLIKAAREADARFIFISSQTARIDAPTAYGRNKWQIEQEVLLAGGWVVRPGQVYGGRLSGLFGLLVNIVHRLPTLPAFFPTPRVQPIHVGDLAEGLLLIAERCDVPSGIYCLAAAASVSFSKFIKEMSRSRLRCRRGFVPVPVSMVNVGASVLPKVLRTKLGLERMQSLFSLPVMDTQADLNQLGLKLRLLRSGMHPSGDDRRRCLLQEGKALLIFVLKKLPNNILLRRYVRVIEQLRDGRALGFQQIFLSYPIFLSMINESDWASKKLGAEYAWRLDTATVLAEATPLGSYRFLNLDHMHGMLGSFFSITKAIVLELFWRGLRVLFFPIVRTILRREKGEL